VSLRTPNGSPGKMRPPSLRCCWNGFDASWAAIGMH